jgi:D-alanyl-D-alanine carboxypeptidase (penicillin-binding protein 5/6)
MKTIAKSGTRVAEAEVWMGDEDRVGLVPESDVERLIPITARNSMTAEVVYTGPIKAPIAKGDRIAELVVRVPDMPDSRIPLVAEADVPEGGFTKRISAAAQALMKRVFAAEAPAT